MTLIAGIRGIGKCFIAADSRETRTLPDGTIEHRDDVRKWMNYGKGAVSACAGDANLAAFLTTQIASTVGETPTYMEVKQVFDERLEEFAIEFNKKTGRYCSCTMMLTGFNMAEKDTFDGGRLGEVMAGEIVNSPDGTPFQQYIDKDIIHAMHYALTKAEAMGTQVGLGTAVLTSRPKSELTGYKIGIRHDGVVIDIDEADNYQALFYGADSATNRIDLPNDMLSRIYFPQTTTTDRMNDEPRPLPLTHTCVGYLATIFNPVWFAKIGQYEMFEC